MSDLAFTCRCGHKIRITEEQLGMETSCPVCKADIRFTENNTEPIVPSVATDQTAPREPGVGNGDGGGRPGSPEDRCARCGRPFRGDWDKHESPLGTLCNVCANLARSDSPGTPLTEGEVRPVVSPEFEAEPEPEPKAEPEPKREKVPRMFADHPREFRIGVAVAAGLVVLAAMYYSFTDSGVPVQPPSEGQTAGQAAPPAHVLPAVIVIGVGLIVQIFKVALPIYLVLFYANRLPYDRHWQNAVTMAPIFLVLALLTYVPYIGGLLSLILIVMLLWERYDLEFYYLVLWAILALLSALLLWALKMIILGALAQVFT